MRREIEQDEREILELKQTIENEQRAELQAELPSMEEKTLEIPENPQANEILAQEEQIKREKQPLTAVELLENARKRAREQARQGREISNYGLER